MTWNSTLAVLRDTFARLYPRRADAERVAADAGLDPALIAFDDRPINSWHSIFEEAVNQGRVDALLDQALQSYPNNESLRAAADAYRSQLARSREAPPPVVQPSAQASGTKPPPAPGTKPSIEGRYYIYGKNAGNGSTYGGEATITRKGQTYEIAWAVGEEKYSGSARLQDNTLICDDWSAQYEIQPDGILDGRWGTDGIEVLTPMRFLSPAANGELPPEPAMIAQMPGASSRNAAGGNTTAGVSQREEMVRLRRLIVDRLSDDELRDLCFELGVEYEDLGGTGRAGKARELLEYCAKRERLADLIAAGKRLRSDVPWDGA